MIPDFCSFAALIFMSCDYNARWSCIVTLRAKGLGTSMRFLGPIKFLYLNTCLRVENESKLSRLEAFD